MSQLVELFKFFLPTVVIGGGLFLLLRAYIVHRMTHQTTTQQVQIALPLRLAAYERMSLFLERIRPANLLRDLPLLDQQAAALHPHLLEQIRAEFAHNLPQQVYLTHAIWNQIQTAMEETIVLINHSAQLLKDQASATDLARQILHQQSTQTHDSIEYALKHLKEEAQKHMGT